MEFPIPNALHLDLNAKKQGEKKTLKGKHL